MEIKVEPGGSPSLVDPDDFRGFKVTLVGDQAAGLASLRAAGIDGDGGHVWVPVDVLRDLAGSARTERWESQLSGMLAYAGSKGWLDDAGRSIRAHVDVS